MTSFTQVFGGETLLPASVSLREYTFSADTTLVWPLEAAQGSGVIVADIVDADANGAYTLVLPDADKVSLGQGILFNNVSAFTLTLVDAANAQVVVMAAGTKWQLYVRDNTSAAGGWRALQFGAAITAAQSSVLAGPGIAAVGATLAQAQTVVLVNSNFTLGVADRAAAYVWTGGLGALTLPAADTAANNWFVSVRNEGTGNCSVTPSGVDTVNGDGVLTLRPGDSATFLTDGASWYTLGLGRDPVFAFDYTSVNLAAAAASYSLSGAELNRIAYKFVGVLTNNVTVIVPSTTQQYWASNQTTGGSYTVSIGTATQASPLTITRGARGIYYCDGSDVLKADTASISLPIAISDGGTGAANASAARVNLGGTTTGIALFTAANATAGRTALGSGAVGDTMFTAASAAAARTAMGATAVGDAVFAAASAAAGRSALSAAASGSNGDITALTHASGILIGGPTGGAQGVGTINATGLFINGVGVGTGSGSVTSVQASGGSTGLSFSGGPVTTSGTLTLGGTLGVANGGTGQSTYTNGQLLIGNSTGNTLTKATLTAGSGISITNGAGTITIDATGGGGSVTSVAASGGTTGLTFSGGPITGAGTLTLGGTLGVANGGTGQSTYTNGQLLIGNSTGNTLTKATLTAGTGISITNGAGSITIAATTSMVYPGSGIAVSTGAAWGTSLTAPSGTIVGTTDSQTLTNKTLTSPTITGGLNLTGSTRSSVTAVGALSLDWSVNEMQTKSISTNSTFTFTGATAGKGQVILLELTITSAAVPTFTGVTWSNGVLETLGNGVHLLGFLTFDGGTSIRGIVGGMAFA